MPKEKLSSYCPMMNVNVIGVKLHVSYRLLSVLVDPKNWFASDTTSNCVNVPQKIIHYGKKPIFS